MRLLVHTAGEMRKLARADSSEVRLQLDDAWERRDLSSDAIVRALRSVCVCVCVFALVWCVGGVLCSAVMDGEMAAEQGPRHRLPLTSRLYNL